MLPTAGGILSAMRCWESGRRISKWSLLQCYCRRLSLRWHSGDFSPLHPNMLTRVQQTPPSSSQQASIPVLNCLEFSLH